MRSTTEPRTTASLPETPPVLTRHNGSPRLVLYTAPEGALPVSWWNIYADRSRCGIPRQARTARAGEGAASRRPDDAGHYSAAPCVEEQRVAVDARRRVRSSAARGDAGAAASTERVAASKAGRDRWDAVRRC